MERPISPGSSRTPSSSSRTPSAQSVVFNRLETKVPLRKRFFLQKNFILQVLETLKEFFQEGLPALKFFLR